MNAATWLPLQRELGDDVEFIAPDLPGHGTRRQEHFTIAAAMKTVEEALAGATPRRPVVVIGDSLGGYLALLAAARAGDRVHAVVAGGASFEMRGIGGSLVQLTDVPVGFAQFCLGNERSERLFNALIRRVTDAATADAIITRGVRLPARSESIRALQGVDILAAVKQCRGRVYIVNGGFDIPAVWYTREFASRAKDGYAVVIPGALHGCAISRPVEFTDVIRTAIAAAHVDIARHAN